MRRQLDGADDAIAAQDWPRICALASAAVRNLLNMKLAHVAVNCADDEEARNVANLLCAILAARRKSARRASSPRRALKS